MMIIPLKPWNLQAAGGAARSTSLCILDSKRPIGLDPFKAIIGFLRRVREAEALQQNENQL